MCSYDYLELQVHLAFLRVQAAQLVLEVLKKGDVEQLFFTAY